MWKGTESVWNDWEIHLATSNVSSLTGLRLCCCLYSSVQNGERINTFHWTIACMRVHTMESNSLPFSFRSVSIPPRLTNEIFHSNSKTFFIGKCGAVPPQKRVIIFSSLTASNSSPIGVSSWNAKTKNYQINCIISTFTHAATYSVHLKMFRQYLWNHLSRPSFRCESLRLWCTKRTKLYANPPNRPVKRPPFASQCLLHSNFCVRNIKWTMNKSFRFHCTKHILNFKV